MAATLTRGLLLVLCLFQCTLYTHGSDGRGSDKLAHALRGDFFFESRQYQNALSAYNRALSPAQDADNDTLPISRVSLSAARLTHCLIALGDIQGSLRWLEYLLKVDPFSNARRDMTISLMHLGYPLLGFYHSLVTQVVTSGTETFGIRQARTLVEPLLSPDQSIADVLNGHAFNLEQTLPYLRAAIESDRSHDALFDQHVARKDRLCRECAGGSCDVINHKMRHSIEQYEHLQASGLVPEQVDKVLPLYRRWLSESHLRHGDMDEGIGKFNTSSPLARWYLCTLHVAPALPVPVAVNPNPTPPISAIEDEYFFHQNGIVMADNVLTPKAVEGLYQWSIKSDFWSGLKRSYLGAYLADGFFSPLLMQVASELQDRYPRIFEGRPHLRMAWGYKYECNEPDVQKRKFGDGGGIHIHADQAKVNVNMWVTPDDANLNQENGGLVVARTPAPSTWPFPEFNCHAAHCHQKILNLIEQGGNQYVTVPYRHNRMIAFDSSLFHYTDDFHFKPDYCSRRINITFLYGDRPAPSNS